MAPQLNSGPDSASSSWRQRLPSVAFWLQSAACAVVGWTLWHGGLSTPAADARDGAASPATQAAKPAADAADDSTVAASASDPAAAAGASPSVQLAAAPSLESATLALSSIDVVVTRNDTLDRIFRRLKLNLADLASLRSLPGVRAALDSLRPGESLHLTHKDGALFGFERRLNDSQTLKVWREGAYVKDGPIEAAEFVNQGRAFRAVRYTDPQGGTYYYTPDGRSLHREFLRAPVEFTRISSRFNSARMHPILNRIRAHKGIDYAAPIGTPVHAAGDGRIRFAGWMGGYGNLVEIEHSSSIVTVYGHLSRFANDTRVGAHVTQGTVIAYVGMTGLATGPHLHYEYRVNGVFKDPQTVTLPGAPPIDARWRADFLSHAAALVASLDPPMSELLVSR